MRILRPAVVVAALLAMVAPVAREAHAQFYEKVDLGRAAIENLVDSLDGTDPAIGSHVATLAGCGDPAVAELFRAMARSGSPRSRVYGVLGDALVTGKGIDPQLYAKLADRDERSVVIREANATGIIRKSPAAELIAAGEIPEAALLSLTAELDRRGEPWAPGSLMGIAKGSDPVAAGFASLLLRDGAGKAAGDPAPWKAFRARLMAMPAEERSPTLRGLVEATLLFEIRSAAPVLLALSSEEGFPEDVQVAAMGMALRLDPKSGVSAWLERVRTNRSQLSLLRSGMQLLASAGPAIPPTAFDELRNGNAVLAAIADAGAAVCRGEDPVPTIIALLDAGHSASAEWALVRAAELPPEKSAPVWRHLLGKFEASGRDDLPTATLVTGLARELAKSDPAAAKELLDRIGKDEVLMVAALAGLAESRSPQAQDLVRARRGGLPRLGESLAVLILAEAGAPLSDADVTLLGRAGAGGGDLDAGRALQAAWFLAKRRGTVPEAVARLAGAGTAAPAAPPAEPAEDATDQE
jgi:hypothetical protein